MLLENKGIIIDNFFIPPFCINKGEIVSIHMFGGEHFNDLKVKLTDILCGKTKNDNFVFFEQFNFLKSEQTLLTSPNIIFDLIGQDLSKSLNSFEKINLHVQNGGAAIFLDNFNDFSFESTRYVEIEKI